MIDVVFDGYGAFWRYFGENFDVASLPHVYMVIQPHNGRCNQRGRE